MYERLLFSKPNIIKPIGKECLNCKYFRNSMLGSGFGKCSKFIEKGIEDKQVHYFYAKLTRKHECKGNYFEETESILKLDFNFINKNEDI